MQVIVMNLGPKSYDQFYAHDVQLRGYTAILQPSFLLVSTERKEDLLQTIAIDDRIRGIVVGPKTGLLKFLLRVITP